MCELLGMSFNKLVRPTFSFRGFSKRGKCNRDGWGIAFYTDESVSIFKEHFAADESKLARFIRDYPEIESKIFIAHVRIKTRGVPSHKNTHPFVMNREGIEYVFAHNGNLTIPAELVSSKYHPVGMTDSESAFCYLLSELDRYRIIRCDEDNFDTMVQIFLDINAWGKFNCLFSDGQHLFAYYDKTAYGTLQYVQRTPPYDSKLTLVDEDWQIDLSMEKPFDETGYIIATSALTEEETWTGFEPGELKVFKNGKMIYSNIRHKKNSSNRFSPNKNKKES